MKMKISAGGGVTLALLLCANAASAQSSYEEEYQNRIKSAGAVEAFSDSPFGENIDLYTGEVSFTQTDLRLEGTGPAIVIQRRSRRIDLKASNAADYSGFGDWDLVVPSITSMVAEDRFNPGQGDWRAYDGSGGPTTQRCTYLGNFVWSPPRNYYGFRTGGIDPTLWWSGYTLDIAGQQKILSRVSAPGPSSGTYPGVTTQHWQIGCLSTTTSGPAGEGFLALGPDGTKYFLSHLSFRPYDSLRFADEFDPTDWTIQPRVIAVMQVVRVEDRFGNYVTYSYTGNRLTSISASDGRAVSLTWVGNRIQSVTSNSRTWNYAYSVSGDLASITLPDDSQWQFTGSAAASGYIPVSGNACGSPDNGWPLPNAPVDRTFTIKAPSGAQGSFTFFKRGLAITHFPAVCLSGVLSGNPYFVSQSLKQRSVSGAGLTPGTWTYSYEVAHPSIESDCTSTPCQSTIYTDVVDPSGTRNRYTHSMRFGALLGKLLQSHTYSATNSLVRSVQHSYNYAETDKPYPGTFGWSMYSASPPYSAENLVVLRKTATTQQGRTFTWEVPTGCTGGLTGYCLNAFGNPTKVVKSSNP